jgi:G:T-mismatch repair DNA endonuclease (very short patch repair protein)
VTRALRRLGWEVVVIWECQLRGDHQFVLRQLTTFLGGPTSVTSFDRTRDPDR